MVVDLPNSSFMITSNSLPGAWADERGYQAHVQLTVGDAEQLILALRDAIQEAGHHGDYSVYPLLGRSPGLGITIRNT